MGFACPAILVVTVHFRSGRFRKRRPDLNILQLRSEFRDNGPGSQAISIGRELRQRGHSVVFASSGGVLVAKIRELGFDFVEISTVAVDRRSLLDSFKTIQALKRLIIERNFDAIHAHNAASSLLASVAVRLARKNVRLIQSVRGLDLRPMYQWRNWVYRINPASLLAVSEFTRRQLLAIGAKAVNVYVTYNGVDFDRFNVDAISGDLIRQELNLGDGPIVGHVGNFSGWKGQDILLRAVNRVRNKFPSIRLVLVGDGPARCRVADLVRELGMEHCVRLPGLRLDVPEFQAAFDLYSQPSTKGEMFPNAILEAMAMGNYWVGSDISGLSELTDSGRTGRVVEPGNVLALAEAIDEALSSPGLKERGLKAREFVRENFSIEKVVDRIETVYMGTA